MTSTAKCSRLTPFAFGAVLIAVGTYLVVEQPQEDIFRSFVAVEAELVKGNTLYEKVWSGLDIYFKAYLFHVENPDEVMEGELPELVERGPYVYNMPLKKKVLRVDEEADEIEYMSTRTMYFNKEMSKGTEDDEITLINSGYVGTIGAINSRFPMFLPKFGNDIHKLFPDMEDVFVRGKVGDFMFGGLPMICDPVKYPELKMICGFFAGNLPDGIDRTDTNGVYKWSFFGMLNGTTQGPFTVNRGVKNKTLLGDTTVFRGKRKQRLWGKDECNWVHGTDSITWAPMEKKLDQVHTFEWQICRPAVADYKKDVIIHGLVGWRYELSPRTWDPERFECYCPMKRKVPICPIRGVMELTACKEAPLYYSEPHFLHGDPELLKFASNLNPKEELHSNFISIEPYSGAPLAGSKKMQINVKLFKSPIVTMLANVSEGYFPVFWVEETAQSTIGMLSEIIQGHRFLRLLRYLIYLPLLIGIFIIVKAIVLFDMSDSDAIITPMATVMSPPVRTIAIGEHERLVNWRPRRVHP